MLRQHLAHQHAFGNMTARHFTGELAVKFFGNLYRQGFHTQLLMYYFVDKCNLPITLYGNELLSSLQMLKHLECFS